MRRRKTVDDLLRRARRRIARRLGPAEAHAAAGAGEILLVDLRSNDERVRFGVIPGSLHVPYSVLQWRADPQSGFANPRLGDFEQRIVLVCAQGYSSSLAAESLVELGYRNATDLIGGYEAWQAEDLPTQAPPEPGLPADELPGMGPCEPAARLGEGRPGAGVPAS